MKTYECKECGQEIKSSVPPKRPCKCGARGKWKPIPAKLKHRFKVGDVLEAQGARLKIVNLLVTSNGRPAYEMVSPFTKGEPWLVGEWALEFARKVRKLAVIAVVVVSGFACATASVKDYAWEPAPEKDVATAQADMTKCLRASYLVPAGRFGDGQEKFFYKCMFSLGHKLVEKRAE